jgi:hypothetical protein
MQLRDSRFPRHRLGPSITQYQFYKTVKNIINIICPSGDMPASSLTPLLCAALGEVVAVGAMLFVVQLPV